MSLETTTSERRSSGSCVRPRVRRDDELLGGEQPPLGAHGERPLAAEPRHARVLVDAHAALERDAPQPARQQRRLDRRRAALEHAGQVGRRAGAARDLGGLEALERVDAVRLAQPQHALPDADVRRRRGRPQEALADVVAVDPVRLRELAELADRCRGRAPEPHRLLLAADLREARELRPPAQHHAAVAARRPAAADVLLEHDDVARGVVLLDADRGPQADEAAAGDRDVGARGALERRRGIGRLGSASRSHSERWGSLTSAGGRPRNPGRAAPSPRAARRSPRPRSRPGSIPASAGHASRTGARGAARAPRPCCRGRCAP